MVFDDFLDISLFKEHLDTLKTSKGLPFNDTTKHIYFMTVQTFITKTADIADPNSYLQFLEHHSRRKRNRHYYAALRHWVNFKFEDKQTKEKILAAFPAQVEHKPERKNEQLTEEKRRMIIINLKSDKSKIMATIQKSTGFRIHDVFEIKVGDIYYEPHPRFGWVLKIDTLGKNNKPYVGYIFDPYEILLIVNYCHIIHPDIVNKEHNVIKQAIDERKGKPTLFDDEDEDPTANYYFLESFGGDRLNPHKVRIANYMRYYKDLKEACKKNHVHPYRFASHSWRKNIATEYYQKHKDIVKVKKLLNHSNIETTLRYIAETDTENIYEELANDKLTPNNSKPQ